MILDKIVDQKRKELEKLKSPRKSLFKALSEPAITVIGEIKRASPSKGIIKEDFDPVEQARKYEEGGAGAISILTDRTFFKGDEEILRTVRKSTDLPLLRKDFLIDPLEIDRSFFMGADIVLLIAAILTDSMLEEMLLRCKQMGVEALVEVHNEEELERVLRQKASIIGINNRDLTTFETDLSTSVRLLKKLDNEKRKDYRIVSESAIATRSDVERLEEAGADGILVGESLMRCDDPARMIGQLRGLS